MEEITLVEKILSLGILIMFCVGIPVMMYLEDKTLRKVKDVDLGKTDNKKRSVK